MEATGLTIRSNGDGTKTAPVSLVARTGDAIETFFWGRVVHDLSGMMLSKSRLPIDWNHSDELIGTLNKFDISSGDLVASGFLKTNAARNPDHAAIVMNDATGDESIPYEASINFGGDGIEVEEVPEGMSVEVNGRQFTGPIAVIRKWPLRGVAITPYGADQHTSTNFASGGESINGQFIKKENSMSASETIPAEAEKTAVEATTSEPAKADTEVVATEAKQEAPPAEAVDDSKPHERYTALGGDKGASAFLAGVPFDQFALSLIVERNKQIEQLTGKISDLEKRLSEPTGNPAAGFSAGDSNTAGKPSEKMIRATGSEALAKFASGMKFAK
jgi:hypothetical protein